MLATPILFLIFNRLDTTEQVLAAIRQVRPKQLFIAADGPRSARAGEGEVCEQVRNLVDAGIDWPCEVHRLYRKENMGCGLAVSTAIDWFFENVDKGIILEDDTLPDVTFFDYCQSLLNHYEEDERIMHISAMNLQCGIKRGNASYYFSRISGIWGWATWKRAWQKYSFDFSGDSDNQIRDVLKRNLSDDVSVNYFFDAMIKTKSRTIDTWDYQWVYTLFKHNAICVTPEYNLIQNLGFNSTGSHTFSAPYWYKYLVNKPINDLLFSDDVVVNEKADAFYFSLTMGGRTLETSYIKLIYKVKKMMSLV